MNWTLIFASFGFGFAIVSLLARFFHIGRDEEWTTWESVLGFLSFAALIYYVFWSTGIVYNHLFGQ